MLKQTPFFLKAMFFWYCLVYISTVFLSYLHLLEGKYIIGVNIIFLASLGLLKQKKKFRYTGQDLKVNMLMVVLGLLFMGTFIQGFFSAPNTTDSMVYHLTRVMYWIQEKSVFQSDINNAHDFMPPFAEYLTLHLYLLLGNDRLVFISQWFAYISTVWLTDLVATLLGAGKNIKKLIVLLVATLPIALLEATSTQTDMVATFLVLFVLYAVLKTQRNLQNLETVTIGVMTGLTLLVKPSTGIFLFIPLTVLFLKTFKKLKKSLLKGLVLLFIVGILQLPYYTQNKKLFGSFMGEKVIGGSSIYINSKYTLPLTTSNIVRNILINIPIPIANKQANYLVDTLHKFLGVSVNDSRNTFQETFFRVQKVIYPQEDIVANPIQIFILLIGLGVFVYRYNSLKVDNDNKNIMILLPISLIMFSAYLRWQPFHSRLLMPFYVIGTISGGIFLSKYPHGHKVMRILTAMSVVLAGFLILLNVSRPYIPYNYLVDLVEPYIPANSSLPEPFYTRPRLKQYFSSRLYWYEPYTKVVQKMIFTSKNDMISFRLMDGFEYPFWVLFKTYDVPVKVVTGHQSKLASVVISTAPFPVKYDGFDSSCFKTDINYGYACISIKN